jgi:hypothetical protein
MNDPKTILLKILEIIGYQGNSDEFADQLMAAIDAQLVLDLFNRLPEDSQKQLQSSLSSDPQNLNPLGESIKSHFSSSDIQTALQDISQKTITDYLQAVIPTLSPVQQNQLSQYLVAFNTPSS